ncbi:CocE/NonD family hydrolase [Effusibacillus consociatus]|uniref:CocE/NonD family hydrolase n=1 Tax=Effusibacillus consociatus TaxID=1117041 RepID=A0ABV9Q2J8_9BACL
MRKGLQNVAVLLLLLALIVVPAWQVHTASASETAAVAAVIEPVHTSITMSDGINLTASIYNPVGQKPAGGWPAVILIHGWGGDRSTYNSIAPGFAQNGYVVMTYDCRGFGKSGGKTTLAGPREMQDLKELMQYLIDRFHVNADKIGASGISYGGGQSFLLAAYTNEPGYVGPKVKAIAPIMGWSDLTSALYPDDVMKASYDLALFAGGYKPDKQNYNPDLPTWLVEGASGVNKADFKQQTALRSVIHHPERLYKVPIYALQAWKDELFPVEQVTTLFDVLQGQNPNLKLYAGGFGHPRASLNNQDEIHFVVTQVLAWFNYWLKGEQNGIMKKDYRVLIGTETWPSGQSYQFPPENRRNAATDLPKHIRPMAAWPNIKPLKMHFAPTLLLNESVSTKPETMVNNPVTGVQDDAIVGSVLSPAVRTGADTLQQNSAPASLRYRMNPLTQDTVVMGTIHLSLWIASANPKAMITARIFDVAANGQRTLVTRGATRARDTGITVPTEVTFDLFHTHHVFQAGHTIELELSPSDTPFFLPDKETVYIRLYHDLTRPSSVQIPVYSENTR